MSQDMHIVSCAMSPEFMSVRVDDPLDAMAALGCRVTSYKREFLVPPPGPADCVKILLVQRYIMSRALGLSVMRQLLRNDWLVVHEYDDHIDLLPAAVRAKFYAGFGHDTFRACHGVQTTTPELAGWFGQFNPQVRAFANQIFRYPLAAKTGADKVRLFYGALNRQAAWQPLMETFNKTLGPRTDIRVTVMGDRAFHDALRVADKLFLPWADYDTYLQALHDSDIVLCPLDASARNACKSDIKFLEASICGAATIASPTVYEQTMVHDETGLIARRPQHWHKGLTALIEHPQLRRRLAGNAGRYVRAERMLMQHIHERLDWYRALWSDRAAINARLSAQFPELR